MEDSKALALFRGFGMASCPMRNPGPDANGRRGAAPDAEEQAAQFFSTVVRPLLHEVAAHLALRGHQLDRRSRPPGPSLAFPLSECLLFKPPGGEQGYLQVAWQRPGQFLLAFGRPARAQQAYWHHFDKADPKALRKDVMRLVDTLTAPSGASPAGPRRP